MSSTHACFTLEKSQTLQQISKQHTGSVDADATPWPRCRGDPRQRVQLRGLRGMRRVAPSYKGSLQRVTSSPGTPTQAMCVAGKRLLPAADVTALSVVTSRSLSSACIMCRTGVRWFRHTTPDADLFSFGSSWEKVKEKEKGRAGVGDLFMINWRGILEKKGHV